MPNWVRNKIIIDKDVLEEAFQELLQAVETQRPVGQGDLPVPAEEEDTYRCFDFQSLIPMPKSLEVESGSTSAEAQLLAHICGIWAPTLADCIIKCGSFRNIFRGNTVEEVKQDYRAISAQIHPDVFADKKLATAAMARLNACYQEALKAVPFSGSPTFFGVVYSGQTMERSLLRDMNCAGIDSRSYDAIKKFVETEEGAKLLTFGEQLQENVRLYDAPTWYEWACENWGSKWNAREPVVDTEMRVITFETAWSAPEGIVKALAERFPNISWTWVYADENQGYNVGRFIHEGGVLSAYEAEDASDAAYGIYVELWGENPCMYQDENGAWKTHDCDESCPNYTECFKGEV